MQICAVFRNFVVVKPLLTAITGSFTHYDIEKHKLIAQKMQNHIVAFVVLTALALSPGSTRAAEMPILAANLEFHHPETLTSSPPSLKPLSNHQNEASPIPPTQSTTTTSSDKEPASDSFESVVNSIRPYYLYLHHKVSSPGWNALIKFITTMLVFLTAYMFWPKEFKQAGQGILTTALVLLALYLNRSDLKTFIHYIAHYTFTNYIWPPLLYIIIIISVFHTFINLIICLCPSTLYQSASWGIGRLSRQWEPILTGRQPEPINEASVLGNWIIYLRLL